MVSFAASIFPSHCWTVWYVGPGFVRQFSGIFFHLRLIEEFAGLLSSFFDLLSILVILAMRVVYQVCPGQKKDVGSLIVHLFFLSMPCLALSIYRLRALSVCANGPYPVHDRSEKHTALDGLAEIPP